MITKIVKIYYPSTTMGIEQMTCKIVGETTTHVNISFVNPEEQDHNTRSLSKEEIIRGMEENKGVETKEMKSADFFASLSSEDFFSEMIQEMKSESHMNSNKMIKSALIESHNRGVYLQDANDFDFDKEVEEIYNAWQL